MRKYINLAIKQKLFLATNHPYTDYKLVTEKTDAAYLTIEELKRVELLTFAADERDLETARDMFLLSCYTGLRFGDTLSLTGDNFHET